MDLARPIARSEGLLPGRCGLRALSSREGYPVIGMDVFSPAVCHLQAAIWTGGRACSGLPQWRRVAARRDAALAWTPGPPLRSDLTGLSPHVGLIVDGATLVELAGEDGERFIARLCGEGGARIAPLDGKVVRIALALEQALRPDSGSRLLREAKALELLAHLIDVRPPAAEGLWSRADRDRLAYARERLLQDLANPPTIAELARACGLNTMKLKRDFKRMFGAPIYAYHRRERLRRALELIETEHRSVSEAAGEVGYSNLGHFSAAFRSEFGLLPREAARRR